MTDPAAAPARPEAPSASALPEGSRDVLAVEAGELTVIERALSGVFDRFGYREVRTPVLELAAVLDRAQEGGLGQVFRLFDDRGRVLVMRPDLTIPASRLIATRMADHPGPVRVSYLSRAFRPPPAGRPASAEQLQAGVELVGPGGPAADAEALAALVEGLRASGLGDFGVAIADVSLTQAVLDGARVPADAQAELRRALAERDFVAWRRTAEALRPPGAAGALLPDLPGVRGGPEALERVAAAVPAAEAACARLGRVLELLTVHGAADPVMVDLGVMRDWPYYSGVVFEAYAPGAGAPIAMGGRYDGLAARFGRPRPAVGFAIALDLLHRAVVAGGAADRGARPGVVLIGGLEEEVAAAAAARGAGLAVIAVADEAGWGEALAAADGWRFVARRDGAGYAVHDRLRGVTVACDRLEEALTSAT
jgi:ATP phosphoribosyltransferase regulatory subunit